MPAFTVLGHPRTRTFRVIWMLEELGEDYEIDPAGPNSDRAREVTVSGKIPALLVDGTALTDSAAILTWLADSHGALTHPAGTLERARQDAFLHFALDELDGVLWTAAKNSFALPEEHRTPDIARTCAFELSRSWKTLEARMGAGSWVTGETFTIADLLIAHCMGWASRSDFGLPDAMRPFMERAQARPAFAAAQARAAAALEAVA